MAAPTLPHGVTGPASANLTTAGRDVVWIEISPTGRLKQCRCASRYLLDAVASGLGLARPTGWGEDLLAALRGRTGRNFQTHLLTRESLRVAIWYAFGERGPDGRSPAGLPDERIWLPNHLTLPTRAGLVIPPATTPGMECHPPLGHVDATAGDGASTNPGGASGGSGGGASTNPGGASGGSGGGASTAPAEPSLYTPATIAGGVLVMALVAGLGLYVQRRREIATPARPGVTAPARGRTSTGAPPRARSLADLRKLMRTR